MREIEDRIGIDPLDQLHAERRTLITKVARLRALWGPNGLGPHYRKAELSKVEELLRAEYAEKEEKVSEARLDQQGHADQRYLDWLGVALCEYAEMVELENAIREIDERINRGQAIARYATAEAHLG